MLPLAPNSCSQSISSLQKKFARTKISVFGFAFKVLDLRQTCFYTQSKHHTVFAKFTKFFSNSYNIIYINSGFNKTYKNSLDIYWGYFKLTYFHFCTLCNKFILSCPLVVLKGRQKHIEGKSFLLVIRERKLK